MLDAQEEKVDFGRGAKKKAHGLQKRYVKG